MDPNEQVPQATGEKMTGLKSDAMGVEKGLDQKGAEPERLGRSEIKWLHQRIQELVAAISGKDSGGDNSGMNEKILRFASDATGAIFYELDMKSRQFRMISGLKEIGRHGFDLSHQWWCDRIHPGDRSKVRAQFEKAVAEGVGFRMTYRIRHKDECYIPVEEITMSSQGTTEPSVIGCVVGIPSDRTTVGGGGWAERERAGEEILREYAGKLESINQELRDLASAASQNLLDPLRKIRVFGELMATKWSESGEVADYLNRMQNAAVRMQSVVNGLQLYSQIDKNQVPFFQVDLGRVVKEALGALHAKMRETGAQVEIGELPSVTGNSDQIRLLFQNLIENGLKFHPRGKPPHIKISAEGAPDEAGSCRILVEDKGIGFDEKGAGKIFSPFHRLLENEDSEGIGMGLALCKRIIERHGGTITAKSAAGQGATFTVAFPGREAEE